MVGLGGGGVEPVFVELIHIQYVSRVTSYNVGKESLDPFRHSHRSSKFSILSCVESVSAVKCC